MVRYSRFLAHHHRHCDIATIFRHILRNHSFGARGISFHMRRMATSAAAAPTPAMNPLCWFCATSAAPPVLLVEAAAPEEVAVALPAAVLEEPAVLEEVVLAAVVVAPAPDTVEVAPVEEEEEEAAVGVLAVPVAEPEAQTADCGKSVTPALPQI